jgi:type I restriction enzyme S subunit
MDEQRRIAEVLDRAEVLRAKRRAALALLDTVAQSIFLDLFGDPVANSKGWPSIKLGTLLAGIDSGWSPNCLERPAKGDEWGVLKLGAVTYCEYDPSENKGLPPGIQPRPDLEVLEGDVLFTRKNTYSLVGACALVRTTRPRLMMSDLIFRLRLRSDVLLNSTFLHGLLVYPTQRKQVQKLASGTSGSMPNISKARLEAMSVPSPPIRLQEEFVRRIAAVENLKMAHRVSLAQLDALFASLQHRAFRGEL